ncbi:MAG: Rv3235 family protein [Ruaniaceae bacterium]|nr:Rv3235 family protein [Ruaniaceae bacterium]
MTTNPQGPAFQSAAQRLHWDPVRFRAISTQPMEVEFELPRTSPLPEPGPWATQAARACVECLLGMRPSHQLMRWLAPPVFDSLTARVGVAARRKYLDGPHAVRARTAWISEVNERTCEASCTVFDGERFRACALRMREHRGRWLVVALEIG